jgi:hypothetical protein
VAAASVGFAGGALWHRNQLAGAETDPAPASAAVQAQPAGVAIERLTPRRPAQNRRPAQSPARRRH